MAQVILKVVIEHDDPHDGLGEDLQHAVETMLNDSGELSGELYLNYGIKGISVVFEDVV